MRSTVQAAIAAPRCSGWKVSEMSDAGTVWETEEVKPAKYRAAAKLLKLPARASHTVQGRYRVQAMR